MLDRLNWPSGELERSRAITFGRESSFVALGRELPLPARDLFAVTYATMRLADDLVDEVYLRRPGAIDARFLREWLAGYFDEVVGDVAPPRHPFLRAACTGAGALALGPRPWRALQHSLCRDLDGRIPFDWADFEDYAEGACVAPAVVYLAIVEALEGLGRPYDDVAADVRDLALHCYLVHLARDLHLDLRANRQVSCVPLCVLPAEPRGHDLAQARSRLLGRANVHAGRVRRRLADYGTRGPHSALRSLERTLEAYADQAAVLSARSEADCAG